MRRRNTEDLILLFFAILGVIIIALTIYNFAFHSHITFFGEINFDKLSSFAGFIGGIVGTIFSATATILVWMALKTQQKDLAETKKLTQLQIDLSIKPDLFLIGNEFESQINFDKSEKKINFNTNGLNEKPLDELQKLINVGVGIAKYVSYQWDFDFKQGLEMAKDSLSVDKVALEPLISNGEIYALKFTYLDSDTFIQLTDDRSVKSIDILLCYQENEAIEYLNLPYTYLYPFILASTYNGSELQMPENFPDLFIKLSYSDIADNLHSKKFKVDLSLTRRFGNFQGINSPFVAPILNGLALNNVPTGWESSSQVESRKRVVCKFIFKEVL